MKRLKSLWGCGLWILCVLLARWAYWGGWRLGAADAPPWARIYLLAVLWACIAYSAALAAGLDD